MDAATLLEQYTQDLSNLPQELTYLLGELREKDMKYYETRKRIQQRDAQLHKYIKQHGSLVKHPKESQIYSKIKEDFEKASKIQDEKCILANTALFLLAKHLARLEKDIGRLETSGMIPHLLDDNEIEIMDVDQDTNTNMGVSNLTQRLTSTTIDSNRKIKHPKKMSRSGTPILSDSISSERSTPGSNDIVIPIKKKREESIIGGGLVKNTVHGRKKFENIPGSVNLPKSMGGTGNNEDDELYCFCQQVSYGAMIACDNPQCKYEWFHYDCVGLQEPPQGIWFCPDCRKSDIKKDDKKKDRKKRN